MFAGNLVDSLPYFVEDAVFTDTRILATKLNPLQCVVI